MNRKNEAAREAVWRANMSLRENALVCGTQGNVSGRERAGETVRIKPSGVGYDRLAPDMIVGVDRDGCVVEGTLRPSVDTPHHLYLYARLPGIGGVCHTHSKFVTVFAMTGRDIPVLTTAQADVFGTALPVTPYVDNQADHIGRAVLECYRERRCPAVILGGHGLFSFGATPAAAAFYALMAEHCAETAWHAQVLAGLAGRPLVPLPEAEVRKWHDRYHSSGYGQAADE